MEEMNQPAMEQNQQVVEQQSWIKRHKTLLIVLGIIAIIVIIGLWFVYDSFAGITEKQMIMP